MNNMRDFMKKISFLSCFVFMITLVLAGSYNNPSTNWQANQPTFENLYSGDFENYWPILNDMRDGQCDATTDFVIGIPPGGCSPTVVTSDLLAEQNVPVFCQLYAIKVNPLIKVSAIKTISFKGDYPEGVRSIVYHPARAAINSYSTLLGDATLENIGYVVIILEQEKVEANISKEIFGNLTATMTYDAEEAYGTGRGDYYLEPMSEDDWRSNYMASSFWNGRGFLRVLDVGEGGAKIQVLKNENNVLRTVTLKEGETSTSSYLPGFYCKAGLKIKLTDITTQEDMARLNVGGNDIWVRKGSKFLDGKCSVKSLNVNSNNDGDITLYCSGAGKIGPLILSNEGVVLGIGEDGKDDSAVKRSSYSLGDKVSDLYVAYYGDFSNTDFVILTKNFLEEKKRKEIASIVDSASSWSNLKEGVLKVLNVGEIYVLTAGESVGEGESRVSFVRLGNDVSKEGELEEFFAKSVDIVENELVEDYPWEEKDNGETWGEDALYEEIVLAGQRGRFDTQRRLMNLFLDKYPLADTAEYVRYMREKIDGTDYSKSFTSAYVGDEFVVISVVDFKSVNEGEKSVDLRVGNIPYKGLIEIGKNPFKGESDDEGAANGVDLNSGSSSNTKAGDRMIKINRISPGEVSLYFYSNKKGLRSKTVTVKEGESEVFDGIEIIVDSVNIKEVAHVSLIPEVKNDKSEASFTFRIDVEKRAIQLSPEKTADMIKNLNKSIDKWQNTIDRLGNVVSGLKGACFATSAVLMIKSMASGVDGEAMARTKIMKKYKEECDTKYPDMTHTECYNKLESDIERDVASMSVVLNAANADMELAQKGNTKESSGLFGETSIVNQSGYLIKLKKEIAHKKILVEVGGKAILVPKDSLYSISQARAVLTWENAEDKGSLVLASAKDDMDNALRNVALAEEQTISRRHAAAEISAEWKTNNVGADDVLMLFNDKTIYHQWSGKTGKDFGLDSGYDKKHVQAVRTTNGGSYLALLGGRTSSGEGVSGVMTYSDNKWTLLKEVPFELRNIVFVGAGSSRDCSNAWSAGNAKVVYYESGKSMGLPASVPIDMYKGWYAMVASSDYTDSADIRSLKICNVGSNSIMQSGTGDDLCQRFDVNSAGKVGDFLPCPGLTSAQVQVLYEKARQAVKSAAQQYGEKRINIFGDIVNVGDPIGASSGVECQDFMSPSDCKMMFNVCDPVICPPSRCDLGGKFPVADVIQTGVIGSLALCLPNAKEGVVIPICLSGVHAGLDSYLSILKSERDCLQHSLDTGEMVGICDQITSIYKCEFFWKQMSPLLDQLIPGVVDYIVGGTTVRGGGEYALTSQAYNTMKSSVSYFKDTYAQNAFRAFNIRSTQEIGSTVCKSFVGGSVPGSADFIENLIAPESPTQFYAQFAETLFTEATVPSTSKYKVYFHIYAGNDEAVQYKVYLRDPPSTSYYSANPQIDVKSGYVAVGNTIDESVDFTAPSGYKELCVTINAKTECGFKTTSTDFGLDYLSNKYVEEQALTTGITTEDECVSGTPSALSLASLNLQSGAEEVISPDISLSGIVRVCASENPDAGVVSEDYVLCDETGELDLDKCGTGFKCSSGKCVDSVGVIEKKGSRWKDVGYCGDAGFRCWLDVDSVKDDLGALSVIDGVSYNILDERRGLINNTRLDLKGVANLLSLVRGRIEVLSFDDLKNAKNKDSVVSKIIWDLDRIIGNHTNAGAGTNGDRAEALFLKASIYRIISGHNLILAASGNNKAVRDEESEEEGDFKKDIEVLGETVDIFGGTCENFCANSKKGYIGGHALLDENSCLGAYRDYIADEFCCCYKAGINGWIFNLESEGKTTDQLDEDAWAMELGTCESFCNSKKGDRDLNIVTISDEGSCKGEYSQIDGISDPNQGCCCYYNEKENDCDATCHTGSGFNADDASGCGKKGIYDNEAKCCCTGGAGAACESAFCGYTSGTSNSLYVIGGSCRVSLAREVDNIVSGIVSSRDDIDFSSVTKETESKSLSCLVLQQAMQESCVGHCKFKDGENSYDYCDGKENLDFIVTGDNGKSIGIMQIHLDFHPEIDLLKRGFDVYSFDDNVKYGVGFLVDNFKSCGTWKGALEKYNTGRCDSFEYSRLVLDRKEKIASMFPEICGDVGNQEESSGKEEDSASDSCSFVCGSGSRWSRILKEDQCTDLDGDFIGECCCLDGAGASDDVINNKGDLGNLMKSRDDCNCGDKCVDYAKWIEKYSEENEIDDPLRVLAIMIKESNCDFSKVNEESYGLMQVTESSFKDVCDGKLNSGNGDFISIGSFVGLEQNIECGVKILKNKYDAYKKGVKSSWSWRIGRIFGFSGGVRNCVNTISNYENYRNWQAAERGYNGWGCKEGADVGYVESVEKILAELKN